MKTDDLDRPVLQSPKTLAELAIFLCDLAEELRQNVWPHAGAVIHGNSLEINLDGKWDSQ